MSLSPEQLSKLKSANLSNLVKKLRAGKTLTAAEMKLIEEAESQSSGRKLVTVGELAEMLGVTRKTIGQWRRDKRPGVPDKVSGKEDANAWVAWLSENPGAGFFDGKPRADRESLLCQKLEVDIAIKQAQLDEINGKLIPRADVKDHFVRVASSIQAFLRKYEKEIPALCLGLPLNQSAPKVKERTREMQAEARERMERTRAMMAKPPQKNSVFDELLGKMKAQLMEAKQAAQGLQQERDKLLAELEATRGRQEEMERGMRARMEEMERGMRARAEEMEREYSERAKAALQRQGAELEELRAALAERGEQLKGLEGARAELEELRGLMGGRERELDELRGVVEDQRRRMEELERENRGLAERLERATAERRERGRARGRDEDREREENADRKRRED
jgi:transcriptional regulator with XRE-family HTH domain